MTTIYNIFLSELETDECSFKTINLGTSINQYLSIIKQNILSNFNVNLKILRDNSSYHKCKVVFRQQPIILIYNYTQNIKKLLNCVVKFDNKGYYFIKTCVMAEDISNIYITVYPNPPQSDTMQIIGYFGDMLHQYTSIVHIERNIDKYNDILNSVVDTNTYIKGEYKTINSSFGTIPRCNISQYNAINNIEHKVEIIQGPPGTGKSTTIVNIIKYRIPDHHTILCTAVQNQAIESLITKLLDCGMQVLVFGSNDRLKPVSIVHSYETEYEKNEIIQQLDKSKKILGAKIESFKIHNKSKNELHRLILKQKKINQELVDEIRKIFSKYQIFLCTTSMSFKLYTLIERQFDTIIMDEAGATTETDIPALLRLNPKNIILIGDHRQLRGFNNIPTHLTPDKTYNISILERFIKSNHKYTMLTIQYRMTPVICQLVSSLFYDNLLKTASDTDFIDKKQLVSPLFPDNLLKNICNEDLINVKGSDINWIDVNENDIHENSSFYNIGEINVIKDIVTKYSGQQILILVPYKAQLFCLKDCLTDTINVDIRTIDSSQGMESDIVIISLVRSNNKNNIGFLNDDNRICVMLSRVRNKLYIVGNYTMFNQCRSSTWNYICKYINYQNDIG
jgi:hypothetical protein